MMKIALLSFEYSRATGSGGIGTYTWYPSVEHYREYLIKKGPREFNESQATRGIGLEGESTQKPRPLE